MQTKTFFAKDMRQAMRDISRDLGPDAVILSNSKVKNGIEVIATAEYEEEIFKQQFSNPNDPYNYSNLSRRKSDTSVNKIVPSKSVTQASQDLIPDSKSINSASYVPVQDNSFLEDIQTELSGLRTLVQEQLLGLTRDDMERRHPNRMKLYRRLLDMGLNRSLARELSHKVPDDLGLAVAWEKSIKILIDRIPKMKNDILEKNRIVTLVGPTGVGKTTTIAKLAARYASKHGCDKLALITTDSFRIGAHEQLKTYSRILDIELHTVSSEQELADALTLLKRKKLVLVDTAGMGHKDERLEHQFKMLEQIKSKKSKTILVLSAATQYESQAETIKTFRNKIDACILSKLDEAANLGAVLSNVIESQIKISYISDGQRVPEDIHDIDSKDIVDRSVSLMRKLDSMEDSFDNLLWGRSVNANV